jgi:hypothetical protein
MLPKIHSPSPVFHHRLLPSQLQGHSPVTGDHRRHLPLKDTVAPCLFHHLTIAPTLDELCRLFPLPGARPKTPSSLRHRPSPTTCTRQPSPADWATQAIMAFGPGQQFSVVGRKHGPAPFIFFLHFGFHLFISQKIIQTSRIHVNLQNIQKNTKQILLEFS